MSELLNIVVVAGTSREKRKSIHVANLIKGVGAELDGVEITFVDVKEMEIPLSDGNDEESKNKKWAEINKNADAYFLVVPEYNHSFPGSLKRLLDNDLGNYTHKPVAFAGVSAGSWGGVRAIESLVNVVRQLGMVATFADVLFPIVGSTFDESGNLQDEKVIERVESSYKELIWMARSLKWGRENL